MHHGRGRRGHFGGRDIRRDTQRSSRNFGRGGGRGGGGRGGGNRGGRYENYGGYDIPEARDSWN